MENNKVALYVRLSDEDRNKKEGDESESIKNQKAILTKHALDNDWEIYDIYNDEDYTGADRNRPDFIRLINDAKARKFNIIMCKSQSRFTRELELVEKYIHTLFPLWGIRFISLVDNADTDNPGNKKARQINGLINEWYLEDLSDNIKKTFDMKKRQGKHIGAFALYGYKKDPNQKGHLIIDEEAAAIVREVFTLFSQGMGKINIARKLNARGIPNPTEYKRRKGLRYKGAEDNNSTLWKYYTIASMLTNQMYIGDMVQNCYGTVSYKIHKNVPKPKKDWIIVKNTHEPIIDLELWEKVQNLIKLKTKPFSRDGKIGIFSKKVKCMNCGHYMRSSKSHDKYYLKCQTRYVGGECIGAFVSVEKLKEIVISELRKLCKSYLDKDSAREYIKYKDERKEKISSLQKELKAFLVKEQEIKGMIKKLVTEQLRGLLDEEEYNDILGEFQNEKRQVQALIEETKKKIAKLEGSEMDNRQREEILESYANIETLEREHIDILIDYIEVGKKDPETKVLPVKIHWNF